MATTRQIRIAVALQTVAVIVAAVALFLTVADLSSRINTIQTAREAAARDTCTLLRGILTTVAPPARAAIYIENTPLQDCEGYGRRVILPPSASAPVLPYVPFVPSPPAPPPPPPDHHHPTPLAP